MAEENKRNQNINVRPRPAATPATSSRRAQAPQNSTPRPKAKRRRKKRSLISRLISAFLILGIIGGGAVYCVMNYDKVLSVLGMGGDFSANVAENNKYNMLSVKEVLYENFDSSILLGDTNSINILLFGLDENESRTSKYTVFRPDTIMMISINFDTQKITIISIPRDTYVNINGSSGKDKINSCFAYASWKEKYSNQEELYNHGVRYLKNTVSALLGGININYYMGLNMDTAAEIIDELGGVYVEMDQKSFSYNGQFLFEGGHRVYNSSDFMMLARLRNYSGGDIDRTKVQQKLLKALFAQLKQVKLSSIPKLVKLAYASIKTDVDMKTAVSFALAALEFDLTDIKTDTFPGMFGNLNGISYWIVNQSRRVTFVKEYYGITPARLAQDATRDPDPVVETPVNETPVTEQGGGE